MSHYSKDLDQSYTIDEADSRLTFQDGTRYTLDEALFISREGIGGDDLRAIHLVKNIFEGDLELRSFRKKPSEPFDHISAIGLKFGPLPILGKPTRSKELQRKIDTAIRKRKGIEECQQTRLDL